MLQYIVRRLLQMIPLILVISFISFGIYQLSPGDPVKSYVPREQQQDPEALERMRTQLGLDKHWTVQYVRWMGKMVQGDLGRSMITGEPVLERFGQAIPNTLKMTVTAWAFSTVVAVAIGVISATRRYSFADQVTTILSFAGIAVPNFFLGILLLLLFSVNLRWFPSGGMGPVGQQAGLLTSLKYLTIPVLALGLTEVAGTSRYLRSSLLEVLKQDYIRTARAKGLSERIVIYKHALRNALMPVVTFMGLGLPGFIGGALVVERLFSWPGMGRVTVEAVFQKDYPMIMAANIIFAVFTVLGNLIADLLYAVVDPRVKFA